MASESSTSDQRVLVTGACGFIGPNLIRELVRRGANVVALDLPASDEGRLPDEVAMIEADLLSPESLAGKLGGFDVVFHLAARTDLDGRSPADYAVNTDGTRNLLEEIGRCGGTGRFVHYSTQLVVGLFNESRFINESEPYRTKTPYGESKIESERIVNGVCGALGIDHTIVRPTSVYGPWGGSPFREFFEVIRSGRYMHAGRAENLVSLVYVKNLVDLTLLLANHPGARNETFFGNDFHPYTMREIVQTVSEFYEVKIRSVPVWLLTMAAYFLGIFKLLGMNVPLYPFRLRNIRMTYCYDISKSVRLGYLPTHDLRSGISETLTWYEERR